MKKRKERVTEVHTVPRKQNPAAPHRVVIMLERDVVSRIKTRAFERATSMQKFLSELINKALKE